MDEYNLLIEEWKNVVKLGGDNFAFTTLDEEIPF